MLYQDQMSKVNKKATREESHSKHRLNKSNYIKMIREEMDDRPEEVVGALGFSSKTDYMKDMESLEKVENKFMTRMQMTSKQKKYHKEMQLK